MLFHSANLPYWMFLGMGVLLFLLVIVSGGGDSDVDADIDADIDTDVDVIDVDTDTDGSFNSLEILGWLGIGKAPLILLLGTDFSLWGVIGWMLNVWVGSLTGGIPYRFFGLGGVVLLSSMAISLFLGGLISRPLGKIFAAFGEDASSDRLIGCFGTVSSAFIPHKHRGKIGQVDVIDSARNLVTISATLPDWATVLPRRNEKVLVIERLEHHYLVVAKDSPDQEHWLENASKIK
ncbi:DUF1449 family protein [Coleofasciculus sp. FACHB-712]|uniref:OB-fold-containig protein n=1 Tax=Coleofasciculus sp. FACHB-712 TaxID=2692789 RepID=UPI0016847C28|nr:OB-fold-containig protein [Coleofasciculus sp. FACHB-712]MBD1941373.1 DUF1449 family protein [Coleofasciculus sp. FACHB-712]